MPKKANEEFIAAGGTALIIKDFSLDDSELSSIDDFDELKDKLTQIISYLLDTDLNRLLNALYRIDISQTKFEYILTNESPDRIAEGVTELILERELQKIKTRARYRDA